MSELSKVEEDVNKEEETDEEEEAVNEGSSSQEEEEPNENLLDGEVSKPHPSDEGPVGGESDVDDVTFGHLELQSQL